MVSLHKPFVLAKFYCCACVHACVHACVCACVRVCVQEGMASVLMCMSCIIGGVMYYACVHIRKVMLIVNLLEACMLSSSFNLQFLSIASRLPEKYKYTG